VPFFDAFGVREDPFGVTPDPRFLYLGLSHREALASLMHGIEAHRGFMALIAPPGMGKTTLLFRLLEHLRASADTIFHFQTQCTARELLRYLLADLGSEPTTDDAVALHQQFNQELLRRNVLGRPVVVVLDEAQNLNDEVLEAIRLLSDFETTRAKLMQIVLSGQEQLLTRRAAAPIAAAGISDRAPPSAGARGHRTVHRAPDARGGPNSRRAIHSRSA
jgi:general secretion pathway protein A